jgi:hypothetical protein
MASQSLRTPADTHYDKTDKISIWASGKQELQYTKMNQN